MPDDTVKNEPLPRPPVKPTIPKGFMSDEEYWQSNYYKQMAKRSKYATIEK